MLWEELTAAGFAQAVVKAEGTCLVPMGVIEKHGDHLPLGTDLLIARALAARAAALEPAVVFPPYYFGQICEARHHPGTLAMGMGILLDALGGICEEIARNGLSKIILVNGHGGNDHFIRFFAQMTLAAERDYAVYLADMGAMHAEAQGLIEAREGGHADETETSLIEAIRPDLVRQEHVGSDTGRPEGRLAHLASLVYTPLWWYGDYPRHQAGDPSRAAPAKGERLLEAGAAHLAGIIRAVKDDTTVAGLQREFFTRARRPL